jgi:hypothetical protein
MYIEPNLCSPDPRCHEISNVHPTAVVLICMVGIFDPASSNDTVELRYFREHIIPTADSNGSR